ncbi:hypothetical protein HYFRA_00002310 [Hymenoscyphus fraxineus]|uniref:Uncharacterized protein n=1 Tax=Hymenoscyphus fraxineus TaxID=746836 RepID=A0A9N9PZ85_9HELO|nr:hypothetical protein HYFRA_00002310 [Hymenoscyphus fraxineus]
MPCSQKKFPGAFSVFLEVNGRKVLIWTSNPRNEIEENKLATEMASIARVREKEHAEKMARSRGKRLITTPIRPEINKTDIRGSLEPPMVQSAQDKVAPLGLGKVSPITTESPPEIKIRGAAKKEPPKVHTPRPDPTPTPPLDSRNINTISSSPLEDRQLSSPPKPVSPTIPQESIKPPPTYGNRSLQNDNEEENFPFTFVGRLKKENALLRTNLASCEQEVASLKRKRQEETDDRSESKRQEQCFERGNEDPRKQKQETSKSNEHSSLAAETAASEREIASIKWRSKQNAEANARLLEENKELQQRMQSAANAHRTDISDLKDQIDHLKKARQIDAMIVKESSADSQRLKLVKRHFGAFVSKVEVGACLQGFDSCKMNALKQEYDQWIIKLRGLLDGAPVALAEENEPAAFAPSRPQAALCEQREPVKGNAELCQKPADQNDILSYSLKKAIEYNSLYITVRDENETLRREVEVLKRKATGAQFLVKQLEKLREDSVYELSTLKQEKEDLKIASSERKLDLQRQLENGKKLTEQIKSLEVQIEELRKTMTFCNTDLDKQILKIEKLLLQNKELEEELVMFKTTSATKERTLKEQIEEMAKETTIQQEEFATFKKTTLEKTLASEKQLEDLHTTHNSEKTELETRINELLTSAELAKLVFEEERERKSREFELRCAEIQELESSLASCQENARALMKQNEKYRNLVGVFQEHQAVLESTVLELQNQMNSIREAVGGKSCDTVEANRDRVMKFRTSEAMLLKELNMDPKSPTCLFYKDSTGCSKETSFSRKLKEGIK